MKATTIHIFILLISTHLICAQDSVALENIMLKEEILSSDELQNWRNAVIEFQKSKIVWLSYRKGDLKLSEYDYEWKTSRWQEIQSRMKQDYRRSDSLQKQLKASTEALYKRFTKLNDPAFKEAIFQEMYQPARDSLRRYRRNIYRDRYK